MSAVENRVLRVLKGWPGNTAFEAAVARAEAMQAYLVGGAMREVYRMGHGETKDLDFMVSRDGSAAFLRDLSRSGTVSLGPFGSPRWFPDARTNHYADIIILENFNNGLWRCLDIKDALNQFDFTANAIAFDIRSGEVHDPQNGIRDATNNVLRAVRFDFPDEPISTTTHLTRLDVMWFRFAHYANALNMSVDEITRTWMVENRRRAAGFEEFSKVFFSPRRDFLDQLNAG